MEPAQLVGLWVVVAVSRSPIDRYEAFADELGHPAGDVALAWLLPAVTAPIVGPRTQEQLDSAVSALDSTPGRRRR